MTSPILRILDAIRDRCAKATPGPWHSHEWSDDCGQITIENATTRLAEIETRGDETDEHRQETVALASFIAHSRTDLDRTEKALRLCLRYIEELRTNILYAGLNVDGMGVNEALARIRDILEGKENE